MTEQGKAGQIPSIDLQTKVAKDFQGNFVYYLQDRSPTKKPEDSSSGVSSKESSPLNLCTLKTNPPIEQLISLSPTKSNSGQVVVNINPANILGRFDPDTLDSLNQILQEASSATEVNDKSPDEQQKSVSDKSLNQNKGLNVPTITEKQGSVSSDSCMFKNSTSSGIPISCRNEIVHKSQHNQLPPATTHLSSVSKSDLHSVPESTHSQHSLFDVNCKSTNPQDVMKETNKSLNQFAETVVNYSQNTEQNVELQSQVTSTNGISTHLGTPLQTSNSNLCTNYQSSSCPIVLCTPPRIPRVFYPNYSLTPRQTFNPYIKVNTGGPNGHMHHHSHFSQSPFVTDPSPFQKPTAKAQNYSGNITLYNQRFCQHELQQNLHQTMDNPLTVISDEAAHDSVTHDQPTMMSNKLAAAIKKSVSMYLPDFSAYPETCSCVKSEGASEIPVEQIWLYSNQMYFLPQITVLAIANNEFVGFKRPNEKVFISVGEILLHLIPKSRKEVETYLVSNVCEKDFMSLEEISYLQQRKHFNLNNATVISLESLRSMCKLLLKRRSFIDSDAGNLVAATIGVYHEKVLEKHTRCSKCGGAVKLLDIPDRYKILDCPKFIDIEEYKCNQIISKREAVRKCKERSNIQTTDEGNNQKEKKNISVGHVIFGTIQFHSFKIDDKIYLSVKELVSFRVMSLQLLQTRLVTLQCRPRPAPKLIDEYFIKHNMNVDNTLWIDIVTVRCLCCMGNAKASNPILTKVRCGNYKCEFDTVLKGYDDCVLDGIVYTINPITNTINNKTFLKKNVPSKSKIEIANEASQRSRLPSSSDEHSDTGTAEVNTRVKSQNSHHKSMCAEQVVTIGPSRKIYVSPVRFVNEKARQSALARNFSSAEVEKVKFRVRPAFTDYAYEHKVLDTKVNEFQLKSKTRSTCEWNGENGFLQEEMNLPQQGKSITKIPQEKSNTQQKQTYGHSQMNDLQGPINGLTEQKSVHALSQEESLNDPLQQESVSDSPLQESVNGFAQQTTTHLPQQNLTDVYICVEESDYSKMNQMIDYSNSTSQLENVDDSDRLTDGQQPEMSEESILEIAAREAMLHVMPDSDKIDGEDELHYPPSVESAIQEITSESGERLSEEYVMKELQNGNLNLLEGMMDCSDSGQKVSYNNFPEKRRLTDDRKSSHHDSNQSVKHRKKSWREKKIPERYRQFYLDPDNKPNENKSDVKITLRRKRKGNNEEFIILKAPAFKKMCLGQARPNVSVIEVIKHSDLLTDRSLNHSKTIQKCGEKNVDAAHKDVEEHVPIVQLVEEKSNSQTFTEGTLRSFSDQQTTHGMEKIESDINSPENEQNALTDQTFRSCSDQQTTEDTEKIGSDITSPEDEQNALTNDTLRSCSDQQAIDDTEKMESDIYPPKNEENETIVNVVDDSSKSSCSDDGEIPHSDGAIQQPPLSDSNDRQIPQRFISDVDGVPLHMLHADVEKKFDTDDGEIQQVLQSDTNNAKNHQTDKSDADDERTPPTPYSDDGEIPHIIDKSDADDERTPPTPYSDDGEIPHIIDKSDADDERTPPTPYSDDGEIPHIIDKSDADDERTPPTPYSDDGEIPHIIECDINKSFEIENVEDETEDPSNEINDSDNLLSSNHPENEKYLSSELSCSSNSPNKSFNSPSLKSSKMKRVYDKVATLDESQDEISINIQMLAMVAEVVTQSSEEEEETKENEGNINQNDTDIVNERLTETKESDSKESQTATKGTLNSFCESERKRKKKFMEGGIDGMIPSNREYYICDRNDGANERFVVTQNDICTRTPRDFDVVLPKFIRNVNKYVEVVDFVYSGETVTSRFRLLEGAEEVFPGLSGEESFQKKKFFVLLNRVLQQENLFIQKYEEPKEKLQKISRKNNPCSKVSPQIRKKSLKTSNSVKQRQKVKK